LRKLREGLANLTVDQLKPKTLDSYHDARCLELMDPEALEGDEAELKKWHRITDLELNTLNSALKWAFRQEKIESNPIANRTRYYSAKDARHAREVARILMGNKHSEAIGWPRLIETHTGLRLKEALNLQVDAPIDEPGGHPSGREFSLHLSSKRKRDGLQLPARQRRIEIDLRSAHSLASTAIPK